jgi:hypothetical protein
MAYQALPSKSAGDTFTLTLYNILKGNWDASAVAIVTAKGAIVAATASQALAQLAVGNDDSVLVADSGESVGLDWQIVPACRLIRTANQDPDESSWVSLDFPAGSVTETVDTNAMHNPWSNSTRITCPTGGDGIYTIGMCAQFNTGSMGSGGAIYGIRLLLNGSTVIAMDYQDRNHCYQDIRVALSTMYPLSAGDYVEAQVYTVQDVNIIYTADYSPSFWAVWQRRQ